MTTSPVPQAQPDPTVQEASASPSGRLGRLAAPGGIVFLAGFLRFRGIASPELWFDECCSVLTASDPRGVLEALRFDTNAPLFFVLLKGWIALFGVDETAVRSLSALLGVGCVAALGGCLNRLRAPRSAALWGMFLCAVAPLQVYYSQEGRGYTLVCLLTLLSLWSFLDAIQTKRAISWILHGFLLLLAFYTHNLVVPCAAAFWAAAAVLRATRRDWTMMGLTHLSVGLLFVPWLLRALFQYESTRSTGLTWVAEMWKSTPPALAIPRSLEAFGFGGKLPWSARVPDPGAAVRFLSILVFGGLGIWAVAGAFGSAKGTETPDGARSDPRPARIMLLFLAVPLGFQFLYSVFFTPIYVVGRYDILAQPAYLGLIAIGLALAQEWLDSWRLQGRAAWILAAGLTVLAVFAYVPKYRLSADPSSAFVQTGRGRLLKEQSRPGDIIVCLGYEGARIAYQRLRWGFAADVVTYPLSTMRHWGWADARDTLEKDRGELQADADVILSRLHPSDGKGDESNRLWLVFGNADVRPAAAGQPRNDSFEITQRLTSAMTRHNCVERYPSPDVAELCARNGMVLMAREPEN